MVNNIAQVAMLLKQGIASRITSATTMNAHSSRSHAIFTVYLQVIYNDPLGHQHIRKAKLNLVDLAGSERHGKTGISTNSGAAFNESKSINLSLCAGHPDVLMSECIRTFPTVTFQQPCSKQ